MRRIRESSLFYEPGLEQLQSIIKMLNEEVGGKNIRRLVTTWHEAGCCLLSVWLNDPQLEKQMSLGKFWIQPYGLGGKIMTVPYGAVNSGPSSELAALAMFTSMMVHPKLKLVGGPCKRCARYYLRKTARQTSYCSRRCGAASTGAMHTRVRRDKEHRKRLESATKAIAGLAPRRNERDWKTRVAVKTGLSVKWLTRAVNKGELGAPRGSGITAAADPTVEI